MAQTNPEHAPTERIRITRKEAARRHGISLSRIQCLENAGLLAFRQYDGKRFFYFVDDVDRFIANRRPPGRPRKVKIPPPSIPMERVVTRYAPELDPFGQRGKTAALVFKAIRDGQSIPEIVIAHELAPDYVRELWDQYHTPGKKPDAREARAIEAAQKADDAHARRLEVERLRNEATVQAARASGVKPETRRNPYAPK